ncbi:MAG: hypothetical protein Q9210_001134 [Variospora velana]
MDEATADTVLSLQLDDVDRLLKSLSNDTGSTPLNYRLVLSAYREELTGRLGVLRDRRMGRSIASAVLTDHQVIAASRNQENVAINDRVAAYQLDRQLNRELSQAQNTPPPAVDVDPTDRAGDLASDSFARLNSLRPDIIDLISCTKLHQKSTAGAVTMSTAPAHSRPKAGDQLAEGRGKHDEHYHQETAYKLEVTSDNASANERAGKAPRLDHSHPSSGPQKRTADDDTVLDRERQTKRAKHDGMFTGLEHPVLGVKKTCACCGESADYFAAVYAPCGHDYCSDCAKRLFTLSMTDESLFPPRCCRQSIPLAAVDVFMTAEFLQYFQEKAVEYTTVDKTYCAWPTCSTFIPPNRIHGETAVCPRCSFWVCTMCKRATHQGRDCPKDTALKELLATAEEAGWQRCYNCKRFVELKHGCNHITFVYYPGWRGSYGADYSIDAFAVPSFAMSAQQSGIHVNVRGGRRRIYSSVQIEWRHDVKQVRAQLTGLQLLLKRKMSWLTQMMNVSMTGSARIKQGRVKVATGTSPISYTFVMIAVRRPVHIAGIIACDRWIQSMFSEFGDVSAVCPRSVYHPPGCFLRHGPSVIATRANG